MDTISSPQPPFLPQPPPLPIPPKSSHLVLLIAGLTLFLGGLGGGFVVSQYLASPKPKIEPIAQIVDVPTPTPTSIPTPDETANWKTYTNTKYGFSFKYPMNFDSTCCGISGPVLGKPEMIIVLADPATGAQGTDMPFNGLGIYIDSVVDFTSADGFTSYIYGQKASLIKNYKDFMDKEPINGKSNTVMVAGVKGEALEGLAWWSNKIIYVPFPDNKKVIVIVRADASKDSFDTMFNQILSTFKFL